MLDGTNSAETPAPGSQERVFRFLEVHGQEKFSGYIRGFADLILELNALNKRITELSGEGNGEEYDQTVKRIVTATGEYYTYISRLPADVREFLMELQTVERGLEGGGSETLALSELTGLHIPMESPLPVSVHAIRPQNYIMQLDAISSQLAKLDGEGQSLFKVGGSGNRPVHTAVTLDIPEHMRIEGGAVLSSYDKSILNSVTSLLESGNTVFSVPMLYHAMTGRQNPTVDEALCEELTGKLEKMRRMMLSIDLTEENEIRTFQGPDGPLEVSDLTLEGYLLPLNKVKGMVNGRRTELYQIIQAPPLYAYSKMKRQLASVPLAMLSAPVNNNATTIPLKTYLLQRIEMMKNQRNNIRQNSILYESVYQELGEAQANKTRKKRIRDYTVKILDYLVERKYIAAYAEYRIGRSVAGVRIELPGS